MKAKNFKHSVLPKQMRKDIYTGHVSKQLERTPLSFNLERYEQSQQYNELVEEATRLEEALVSDFGVARSLLSRLRIDAVREGLLATAYEASER